MNWTDEQIDYVNDWYEQEYRPEHWSKTQKDVEDFFEEIEKILEKGDIPTIPHVV